ncbi:hypothetical protein MMON_57520 [Mycolicibacterium monacense]|uniref:Antitoxin n=4 Tax=Mycobacteriaceae TaxID=1762 RepID=A0AAD1J0Q2_MYCMB|nr:hypothetical protein MMON_57520 [Mycolicibacterium monacense]
MKAMAFLDKVKNWVSKNPDKAGSAIEKAGDLFDQKTKGKYADKVNKAQSAAKDYVHKTNPQQPPAQQPPVNPQNPPLHP